MTETQSPQPGPEIGADTPPAGMTAPAMPHIPAQRQAQGYPPPSAMPLPYMHTPSAPAATPARPLGAVIIAGAILAVGVATLLVWVFVIHPSDTSGAAAPTSSTPAPYSASTTPDYSTGTSGAPYDDYSSAADGRFITTLNSNGIPISDVGTRSSAITAGHSVCQGLDGGLSAAQLVNSIYTGTAFTQYQSGLIVGASVGAYCPRHRDLLPN